MRTERREPRADGERTGVVHDLLHAVAVHEVLDLVDDVDRVARAVCRVKRCPAAERTLRVPAVAAGHDVRAGGTAEVAVLHGVELPVAKVAVDPRRGVEVVVELEAPRVPYLAVRAVPDARLELRGGEPRPHEVHEEEVPVAAREDVVDGTGGHRLVRQRRHVVAHEHHLRARAGGRGLERFHPFPVAFDDGRLRLDHDDVRLRVGQLALETLGRPFLRDAVKPNSIVPRLLRHRGRCGGHDGKDVGGARKPLELPILGEERDAPLRGQWRVCEGDYHL